MIPCSLLVIENGLEPDLDARDAFVARGERRLHGFGGSPCYLRVPLESDSGNEERTGDDQ
jgi:hypothetical protein